MKDNRQTKTDYETNRDCGFKLNWRQVKRALKLLFERRLERAKIIKMCFVSMQSSSACRLMVMYRESTSSSDQSDESDQCSILRWKEDHSSVQTKSWLDLASTLEASVREGKSFSIGRKTVFSPGDSIERALIEADLLDAERLQNGDCLECLN